MCIHINSTMDNEYHYNNLSIQRSNVVNKRYEETIIKLHFQHTQIQIHTQTTKRRILIVDDEPDITFVFKIGLEDNGFVVDTFNDPQQAISNFKADLYDLLLIDIGIPKMNGFEFYRKIRKIDDKVKACFFTASEVQNLVEKYKISDLDCIIAKPIAIEELIERVNEIMMMNTS